MESPRHLIALAKTLGGRPTRENRNQRQSAYVSYNVPLRTAEETQGVLSLYVKVPRAVPGQWSIGLRYGKKSARSATTLLRLNGDQGTTHTNPDGGRVVGPHLHAPSLQELDLPADELRELRWAVAVPAQFSSLPAGWRLLCERGNIRLEAKVERMLRAVEATLAQTALLLRGDQ